jgi:ABC-2 type transport system permease protein
MRGGRAFIVITIYLALLGGLVGMILLSFYAADASPSSANISQALGKTVFGATVGLELMMVIFVAPALTSGAVSAEREHQTYDLLRTTLLSAPSLVTGKLVSALSFLLLLLFVGFPLLSLAYLLGGVSIEEVLIAFILLVVSAIAFSAVGLFVSSFTRRVLVSTVLSYVSTNLIIFGIPVFIYISILFLFGMLSSSIYNIPTNQYAFMEAALLVVGWFFVAFNPIATAIATEIILINEQSAFLWKVPLSNGQTFPIISPWIGFVFFYLLLSLGLIWLSIRFVHRVER